MARGRKKQDDGDVTRGTAPSAGNLDELEKFEASDEAKAHEPSDVDAMGQDKRRQVIGQTYGPSRKSQIMFFVIVAGVIAILIGGYIAAIAAFDQPEDSYADQAPWARDGALTNQPIDPSTPCGEPGNPPVDQAGSVCSPEGGLVPAKDTKNAKEQSSGGVTEASGESATSAPD